ncbi:hypothetical protein PIB30_021921 [Stylosanthes scabra]|uniref:Uncharacterized protein n=1 Tax=Stylosanthes scabra TaxID=79078 RepID=A0ABU6T8T4_9FABA|nr:hypothetical protein [Stylosanthes scabra]
MALYVGGNPSNVQFCFKANPIQSFIPRGNDIHFTVVLLVRFGALAEIGVYHYLEVGKTQLDSYFSESGLINKNIIVTLRIDIADPILRTGGNYLIYPPTTLRHNLGHYRNHSPRHEYAYGSLQNNTVACVLCIPGPKCRGRAQGKLKLTREARRVDKKPKKKPNPVLDRAPVPPLLNGEVSVGGPPARPRWPARATLFRNLHDKDMARPRDRGGVPAWRRQNSLK